MTEHKRIRRLIGFIAAVLAALAAIPAGASAAFPGDPSAQWLPSKDGASWTYQWSNSAYATTPTKEKVTLQSRAGKSFRLGWTTLGLGNPASAVTSVGSIGYRRTEAGVVSTDWSSTRPPESFPILCATASGCGNSLAGTHFLVNWGTRSPVLAEPLFRRTTWNSFGGSTNDSSSVNDYLGRERVVVPAFPGGVMAAKIRSEITQAGALGDPYGSGVRTVWWVYGVGPVKVVLRHAGGGAPVTRSELASTTLVPRRPPSDQSLLPFAKGDRLTYRWHNSRHMRRASTQRFTVGEVAGNSARVDVRDLSGPIRVRGGYVFSSRLTGMTHLSAFTQAASSARFPALGPRSLAPKRRRRFFTPFDLMVYGFNPVVPALPAIGDAWASNRNSRDFEVFGVTGSSRVIGRRTVSVPAGRFQATVVRSQLRQPGYRFGTGTRTSYFAPGKGLVKLVFRHAEGSTSAVELVR